MTPMWVILDLKYSLALRTTEQNDPYVGHFVPPYAYITITREGKWPTEGWKETNNLPQSVFSLPSNPFSYSSGIEDSLEYSRRGTTFPVLEYKRESKIP